MIELRVRDNGSGIPPELLPTIFEPFTQGDHSLERTRGGLGIGLTLVRSLVELHGGSVEALSEGLGKGAEFVVRLPLSTAVHATPVRRPPPQPLEVNARARKILVVDDNDDAAATLAILLRTSGYEVAISGDGNQAMQRALDFRPDVILLDIGLPGKDGFTVAEELRAHPDTQEAVIVAVSGYGQDEDRRRAKEAGINHYFTKPMDIDALRELLSAPLPVWHSGDGLARY